MTKLFISILLLFSATIINAQIKAVTEKGDEVILYSDGTWKYTSEENSSKEDTIAVNPSPFAKSSTSGFLVKSTRTNIGVWINPKKWSFSKSKEGDVSEYEFEYKGDDLYAMLITEKIGIPLENMPAIALGNAKEAAPDARIVKKEYRTVNGNKVLMLRMDGTTQGIEFSYYGYYYSGDKGTVQFITYTAKSMLESLIPEIEALLNGLDVIMKD